jgi:prepilin-type N-terminal cleavage/methylation domain-containing protein
MVFKAAGKTRTRKSGFTLIELIITVAIVGLLATAISVSIFQIFKVNASSGSRMVAIKQVETAINRIRVDVQMAQVVENTDTDPNVFLKLRWKEWDNTVNEVKYSVDPASHQMSRLLSQGSPLNPVSTIVIATNIQSASASVSGENWKIDIAAAVSDSTEIRTIEVKPRPG